MSETKLREQHESAASEREFKRPSGHLGWKIAGGVVLALAATAVFTSLNDIRRYIRMTRM